MPGNFDASCFDGSMGGFDIDAVTAAAVTGAKGDNERRSTYKPTGLLDRPLKASPVVQERAQDSQRIQAEVAAQLAREFSDENSTLALRAPPTPVKFMSTAEIDAEIAMFLRSKIQSEEEEIILLLLVAGACRA